MKINEEFNVTYLGVITKTDGTLESGHVLRCLNIFNDVSCKIFTVFCGDGASRNTAMRLFGSRLLLPNFIVLPGLSRFPEKEYFELLDTGKKNKLRCESILNITNKEFHEDYILASQHAKADYKNNPREQGYVFITNAALGNAIPLEWSFFPKKYPGEINMLYPGDVARISPGKKMSVSRPSNHFFTWW